ncbi:hypothetical protein ACIPWI_21735 [Streptomyces sp. NPDC090046]|uniref:hypothetical protein n=1 Tax=Streptomyces sp. NPDC090046 TaxID=3365928 RepID=UPI0037FE8E96
MDDGPDMAGAPARKRPSPWPERWGGRWLRAAVFTLLSSTLAVVAHRLASEDPVSWQRAGGGAFTVYAVSWLAARSRRPGWYVVAATCLAQLLLHRVLSAHGPDHGPEQAWATPEFTHAAGHHDTSAMTLAHCAAACLMALLMYRADRALSRLPGTMGRWARTAVAAAAAAFGARWQPRFGAGPRAVAVPLGRRTVRPAVTAMLCHAVTRRGPPGRCAGDVPLILAG